MAVKVISPGRDRAKSIVESEDGDENRQARIRSSVWKYRF